MMLQACLNGARPADSHVALPLGADACAEAAVACVAAGAGSIHVHPRDESTAETLDAAVIDAAVTAVSDAAQVPVGVSTGAWIEPDEVARTLAVHRWSEPDFASVNLGEPGAAEVMAALIDRGIGVEAGISVSTEVDELVAGGMAEGLLRVLIEPTDHEPAEALATAQAIDAALDDAGVAAPRLAHGFGVATWSVLEWATATGHDIRIGLEDTLVMPDGTEARDNAELCEAAAFVLR